MRCNPPNPKGCSSAAILICSLPRSRPMHQTVHDRVVLHGHCRCMQHWGTPISTARPRGQRALQFHFLPPPLDPLPFANSRRIQCNSARRSKIIQHQRYHSAITAVPQLPCHTLLTTCVGRSGGSAVTHLMRALEVPGSNLWAGTCGCPGRWGVSDPVSRKGRYEGQTARSRWRPEIIRGNPPPLTAPHVWRG